MKKNKFLLPVILLLVLPVLFSVSGCKKFLDRQPLSATLDDLNQGGVEGQVFGLYSSVKNYNEGQAFTGIAWLGFHGFRSDDSDKGSEPSDGSNWVAPFENFQYVKEHDANNSYWDGHYSLIHKANTALQTADSLKLNSINDKVNIAEARFFRAFAYFDLVRSYGEVPKIDFRIYSASQANVPKSTVPEIYALIDADLQYAAANLPLEWGTKYQGRLTSGAAKSLWAKTYLFRSNWTAALAQLQQVIASGKYALYPSYFGIFKDEGENCSESVLEWQNYVGPNRTDDYGSWYGTSQAVRAANATGWNLGWGWNVPTQALVDAYEPGDVRKGSTILFSGQSDDPATGGYGATLPPYPGVLPQKYWNKKIYADPAMRASTGYLDGAYWINQRVIRYADVLLMTAECMNELGNGSQGVNYVKQVRARVSLPTFSYTSQSQLRDLIKKERRVELGMEGERFFDLVRWGDALTVLGPQGYSHKCRYYPLPQKEIDRSGGVLIQNPEW